MNREEFVEAMSNLVKSDYHDGGKNWSAQAQFNIFKRKARDLQILHALWIRRNEE